MSTVIFATKVADTKTAQIFEECRATWAVHIRQEMERLKQEQQQLIQQAQRLGLEVKVGVADSKTIARVAAQAADVGVVPAGGERARRC